MWIPLSRAIPFLVAAIGFAGVFVSFINLQGWRLSLALVVCAVVMSGAVAYAYGRGKRDKREKVLDELGVCCAYATATEDDSYLSKRVQSAKKIRILAMNAEMLLRNLPTPFKNALKASTSVEILISRPDSELVDEMEQMECEDGRGPGRSIKQCILDTEPELESLIRESLAEIPSRDHNKIGTVQIGYFNTQYRETMIICDDDWVWWTPHLNPARGADRPTFVFQGQDSKLTKMCIRHFEAVKRMVDLREVPKVLGKVKQSADQLR